MKPYHSPEDAYTAALEHHLRRMLLPLLAVTVAAIGATCAVFFGLRAAMAEEGIVGIAVPLVTAIVIGVVVWALWHKTIAVVPLLQDPAKLALGIAIGLLLTTMTILISAWFTATAIGGTAAVDAHLSAAIDQFKEQRAVVETNTSQDTLLISEVERLKLILEADERLERRGDGGSQIAGDGPVARALQALVFQLGIAITEMEDIQRAKGTRWEETQRLTKNLYKLVSSRSSERQQEFAEAALDLDSSLADLNKDELLVVAERALFGGTVSREGLLPAQEGALVYTRAKVKDFAENLRKQVREMKARRKQVQPVGFIPMDAGRATATHAHAVPWAWAVGIGIDLAPLIALLLQVVGRAAALRPYRPNDPFGESVRNNSADLRPRRIPVTAEKVVDGWESNGQQPAASASSSYGLGREAERPEKGGRDRGHNPNWSDDGQGGR